MSNDLALQMRQGMRRLASGVSIVTAIDPDGKRFAMTASSVTSVSDAPPSLLVCIHKETRISRAMERGSQFCINVLAQNQQALSVNCSLPETEMSRFNLGDWKVDNRSGLCYLPAAQSVFFCRKQQAVEYGTHVVFIGDITAVKIAGDINPLIYYDGQYR